MLGSSGWRWRNETQPPGGCQLRGGWGFVTHAVNLAAGRRKSGCGLSRIGKPTVALTRLRLDWGRFPLGTWVSSKSSQEVQ